MKSTTECPVIETIAEFRTWHKNLQSTSDKPLLGFVPTMGALHEGHMTLIRRAVRDCQHVAVSIFVNPMQFGPNEDFDRYPRTLEKDLAMCRDAGVAAVFHPQVEELYAAGHTSSTKVVPPQELTDRLCGTYRPGHFIGVATVVQKLFSIVQPNQAYFGEKDYQQLTIIRRMVQDLNEPVAIVSVATVRESDGLAMSSRNAQLSSDERRRAPELYRTLCVVREDSMSGRRSLQEALKFAREKLSKVPEFSLQYLEVCDPNTLEPLSEAKPPMVILVAAKLGSVRLIDNIMVT
ncbi:MAG: pantoate--beta-alanine ligase [Candidatus Obscuribacterales bacterium]|jgi:pantoate ligase/cytidylate kinase|nr:pantoate--beta-alanine ligase [Candidatus Obscuribacterales bacterium]